MAKKKLAVVVRDRQGEALRMAVGLTLVDDVIDVYVLDRKIEGTEEIRLSLDTLELVGMKVYTNVRENEGMEFLALEEIASRLLEYDSVLPY